LKHIEEKKITGRERNSTPPFHHVSLNPANALLTKMVALYGYFYINVKAFRIKPHPLVSYSSQ
jgi:hypothetical protein